MKHKNIHMTAGWEKKGDLEEKRNGSRELYGESILGTPLRSLSVINDVQSNVLNASVRSLYCPNVAF
jgi:hypothetical protein